MEASNRGEKAAGADRDQRRDTAATAQAAGFVDRILRGAHPGDLPIARPSRFEFIVNLKTTKAFGLTVPPSLRLRADQVIE